MARVRLELDTATVKGRARDAGFRGLQQAAEHVLSVSNERVPHQEGVLMNTGNVDADRARLRASIYYDTPYAVYQHEVLDLRHDNGRQSKYLETALTGERQQVRAIMARALRHGIGG